MTSQIILPTRSLGKTNIHITPIGLGMMEFSGQHGIFGAAFPDLSQEHMNGIVKAALDGGINWFDTAEFYGLGHSERALSSALKTLSIPDSEIVLATKWWPLFRTAANIPRTIQDRLDCLDGYTISLYQVHQPFSFSSVEAEMNAMADLVDSGRIRSVGVSNYSAAQMVRAHAALEKRGLSLAANQVEYSLLKRKIETNGVLQAAKDLGVTIIAYTPLANGILTAIYHQDPELLARKPLSRRVRVRGKIEPSRPLIEAILEIAPKYDAMPAQISLNWLVTRHDETVVAIPGASRPGQAADNAGSMNFTLLAEDLDRLDRLSQQFR